MGRSKVHILEAFAMEKCSKSGNIWKRLESVVFTGRRFCGNLISGVMYGCEGVSNQLLKASSHLQHSDLGKVRNCEKVENPESRALCSGTAKSMHFGAVSNGETLQIWKYLEISGNIWRVWILAGGRVNESLI